MVGSNIRAALTIAVGAASAALLVLSFPGVGLAWLAWWALVPLAVLVRRSKPRRALLAGLATGSLFHIGVATWVLPLGAPLAGFAVAALWCGAFVALAAGLAAWVEARLAGWGGLALGAAWVGCEWLQVESGFLAAPWGVIGYSQHDSPAVSRVAAVAGVYGVSFVLVAANVVLAELAERGLGRSAPIARSWWPSAVLAVGALLLVVAASRTDAGRAPTAAPEGPTLRALLVQAGIYAPDRGRSAAEVYARYRALSREGAEAGADLVVWPEASVAAGIPRDATATLALLELAEELDSHLLIATSGRDKQAGSANADGFANSAFLLGPDRRMAGRYDKSILVPFNEYLPLRSWLSLPSWLAPAFPHDARAGAGPVPLSLGDARFTVLICWENFFPRAFRHAAGTGADFVVSLTNEAFTTSRTPHALAFAINRLRAVENGVWVLRAATTGITAVLSATGEVVGRVQDETGEDLDVEGVVLAEVPLSRVRTPYTRLGDWLPASSLLLCVALLAAGPRRRRAGRALS